MILDAAENRRMDRTATAIALRRPNRIVLEETFHVFGRLEILANGK